MVHGEMLATICLNYSTLPDPRSLTLKEIVFYYNALRGQLRKATKPKTKVGK